MSTSSDQGRGHRSKKPVCVGPFGAVNFELLNLQTYFVSCRYIFVIYRLMVEIPVVNVVSADLMFLETSALNGENVEEAFLKCTRTILAKIESGE